MHIFLGLLVLIVSGFICHKLAVARGVNPVYWGVMGVVLGPFAIPFILFRKKSIQE